MKDHARLHAGKSYLYNVVKETLADLWFGFITYYDAVQSTEYFINDDVVIGSGTMMSSHAAPNWKKIRK